MRSMIAKSGNRNCAQEPDRTDGRVVAFDCKIASRMRICLDVCAQALTTSIPADCTAANFLRVVSYQAERPKLEKPKNLYSKCIVAQIHRMSQTKICFDCVEP